MKSSEMRIVQQLWICTAVLLIAIAIPSKFLIITAILFLAFAWKINKKIRQFEDIEGKQITIAIHQAIAKRSEASGGIGGPRETPNYDVPDWPIMPEREPKKY